MKIYTKTGDKGETGLIGGKRISKASVRIDAYGTADELNAILGVVASQLESENLRTEIILIQNDLHTLCADLASADLSADGPRVSSAHVERLEKLCDDLDENLEPLNNFILPGGSYAGALLHYGRTIARRAERRAIELNDADSINPEVIRYLNRVSDLLFLMARTANAEERVAEIPPTY